MRSVEKSRNIEEYDIIRVIVTLLVLVGHCTSCQINTPFGSADYSDLILNGGSLCFRVSRILTSFIYTFHMPAFFALSGALFFFTVQKNISLKDLLIKKSKRLIIPFVLITILYDVPLKSISNYFNNGESFFYNVLIGQVLIQGNTYLWFLPSLFCIFIIFNILKKYINSTKYIFAIFVIGYFAQSLCTIKILNYVLQYSIWFTLGYMFQENKACIDNKLSKNKAFVLSVICICVILGLFIAYRILLKKTNISHFFVEMILFLIPYFALLLIYLLSINLKSKHINKEKIFRILLTCSFGIYLYSDPWNYVLLYTFANIFGKSLFNNNLIYMNFYLIRILLTFAISFLVTIIIKKTYNVLKLPILKYLT